MRAIRGVINGVLMVTLIKPIARLMVGRWRKRMESSPAATIGLPVQELLEAALVEELAATATLESPLVEPAGTADDARSMRTMLLVAVMITVATTAAVLIAKTMRERRARAAASEPTELVAVPVEVDADVPEEVLV